MITFRFANINFFVLFLFFYLPFLTTQLYWKILVRFETELYCIPQVWVRTCIVLLLRFPLLMAEQKNSFIKLWFSIICHDELLYATLKTFYLTNNFPLLYSEFIPYQAFKLLKSFHLSRQRQSGNQNTNQPSQIAHNRQADSTIWFIQLVIVLRIYKEKVIAKKKNC